MRTIAAVLAGAAVLVACGARSEAHQAVKSHLRDPDSARFENETDWPNGAVCGLVYSKNAMGGYGEPTLFIYKGGQVYLGRTAWDEKSNTLCSDKG